LGLVSQSLSISEVIMKYFSIAALAIIAGCTAQQATKVEAFNAQAATQLQLVSAVVCQGDRLLQPVVVPLAASVLTAVIPTAAAPIAGAVALDKALIHPVVEAACAAIGGLPVAAVVASK
jgi:hypothetical protein